MGLPRWSQSWYAIASTMSWSTGGSDLFTVLSSWVAFLDIDYLLSLCAAESTSGVIGA
jgi:hypothetical protein